VRLQAFFYMFVGFVLKAGHERTVMLAAYKTSGCSLSLLTVLRQNSYYCMYVCLCVCVCVAPIHLRKPMFHFVFQPWFANKVIISSYNNDKRLKISTNSVAYLEAEMNWNLAFNEHVVKKLKKKNMRRSI